MTKIKYIDFAQEDVFSQQVAEEARVRNAEMNTAWQFIANTNISVFLTGKAGTGKTTFLRTLQERTPKRMVILAPTGVAAINAGGQTIHSFFQLPFGPNVPGVQREGNHFRMSQEKKKIIRTLDLLVIDEISMVRCDLLDAVDQVLRKYKDRTRPFGGVQLLLIGDLHQLAPVAQDQEWSLLSPYYKVPYFFGSHALNQIRYVTIELKHIYRQQDREFIDLLADVRENRMDVKVVEQLNRRFVPNFIPPKTEDWIRLTTHNHKAHEYNQNQLNLIKENPRTFRAEISGTFPETSYPADYELTLKVGAQVMFIKNDPTGSKAYYNGKLGEVTDFEWDSDNHCDIVVVYSKEDNSTIMVPMVTWENTRYVIDPESKEISEEVEGKFTQYPLRLAWAITVHKSQGLTFEHAVLDINSSFTHGQVYVALSRCRTLEGLVLSCPMNMHSVISDQSVNQYVEDKLKDGKQMEQQLPEMKHEYLFELLNEMFSFARLDEDFRYVIRVIDEHQYKNYPELLETLKETVPEVKTHILDVALRFRNQYQQLLFKSQNPDNDPQLQQRLQAASKYFTDKLRELYGPLLPQLSISIGNKQVMTQYNNALDAFKLQLQIKLGVVRRFAEADATFSVRNYLNAKAKAALDGEHDEKQKPKYYRKKVKKG